MVNKMAVVFKLDELEAEVKLEISKELSIVPIDPYEEKMRKWGKGIPKNSSAKIPVLMFQADAETGTVRLPFFAAMQRMGVKPNRDRLFPKLCEEGIPEFHAKLRPYQVDLANEAYAQLKKSAVTTLGLPPGWGKTVVGTWLASKANGVIMAFSHRMEICKGWVKTFELCHPQYSDSIWLVGENQAKDQVLIPRECISPIESEDGEVEACGECKECEGEDLTTPRFIVCMDGRIDSVPEHIKNAVCVTIIDEAHLFCTPARVKCLLSTAPKFVIAETATLKRDDGMERMIQTMVGTEGVFRGNTKPYRVHIVKTFIKVPTVQGARGVNFTDLTKKLILSEERNECIVDCVLANMHRKIMILVRYKNHATILQELLVEQGIEVATLFGSKKDYNDSHVLIGTIPKMGTGFDEKNACKDFKGAESNLLLLCTSIANIQLFIQVLGRVMRSKDPVLFYFEDNMGIVKNHIKKTLDKIVETKGEIYEMAYKETVLKVEDMDYSSGVGVVIKKKKKIKIKINRSSKV
jgi:superfamily II DNA or RNA helicase